MKTPTAIAALGLILLAAAPAAQAQVKQGRVWEGDLKVREAHPAPDIRNWRRLGLARPKAGQAWRRMGPNAVLVETPTGVVLRVATDIFH